LPVLAPALLAAARLAIIVVPLGDVAPERVGIAAAALALQYGGNVRIAAWRTLPPDAYDRGSGRYVALQLIADIKPPPEGDDHLRLYEPKLYSELAKETDIDHFLDRLARDVVPPPRVTLERVVVLGVTDAEIAGPGDNGNGLVPVSGLAEATGGAAAVMNADGRSAATAAVAIHEVGHLLGLDHHDGGDCAMDTKHRVPYLCKRCAERVLERLRRPCRLRRADAARRSGRRGAPARPLRSRGRRSRGA
jgi:hypothetical protein